MWEFPSHILPGSNNSTISLRKKTAHDFVEGLFSLEDNSAAECLQSLDLEYVGELGSVPWVFSHLKLAMHVHLFHLHNAEEMPLAEDPHLRRWAGPEAIEAETMGSGMRQCWKLIAEAAA